MGYLVRKFKELENKNIINDAENVDSIVADVLKEFQTCDHGDLSTWRIENLSDINDAILPIALCVDKICEINLIIIDENLLLKYHFTKENESSGEDNIKINKQMDSLHWNIKNVNIGNLKDCVALYWETMDNEEHTFSTYNKKIPDFQVASIIIDAYKNNRITKDQIKCIKSLRKSFPELIEKAGVQL